MTNSDAISKGADWAAAGASLDAHGSAVLKALVDAPTCAALAGLYDEPERFRKTVDMGAHGYGQGQYRYLAYPLPPAVQALRVALYPPLAEIANRWAELLGQLVRYPDKHADFLARCHEAGQTRPTPLILRYDAGDWNALHQDLYGEHVFPLQATVLLSRPGRDFTGGEFILTEQRPRQQSRPEVVQLDQGDVVIFPVRDRPATGGRGVRRVQMRHGVSRLHTGRRFTLGLIFHDAK